MLHHVSEMVSLTQAQALVAIGVHGSIHKAARALGKSHTSVLYLVRTLEAQLGFSVLDRTGYRVRLSKAGQRLLHACERLIAADVQMTEVVREVQSGWEPTLRIVFDGIVDAAPIVRFIGDLAKRDIPTHVDARTEFLSGVEAAFVEQSADVMIAVLPPQNLDLISVPLPAFEAWLLADKSHPLSKGHVEPTLIEKHVLLTVRGSDPRLQLSTSTLACSRNISFHDFGSKYLAIREGIGFGWLPARMAERDVACGRLRRIEWQGASSHSFRPRLYHRAKGLGPAGRGLVSRLKRG